MKYQDEIIEELFQMFWFDKNDILLAILVIFLVRIQRVMGGRERFNKNFEKIKKKNFFC